MSDAAPDKPVSPPGSALSDCEKAERVSALKARVAADLGEDPHAHRFCSDATLERFTRAVNYDVDKAADFVRATLKWRAEKQPWQVTCAGCASNPRAHSLRCVGTDAAGRPVLYHCFSQADGRHVAAHNVAHLQRILEDCVQFMDACDPPVGQWVWIFDFHGYTLWDNNPTTVVQAAQFLPMHPNRLFKVVMVDAPAAFSTLFSMASSFLTDVTKAKITFTKLEQLHTEVSPWAGSQVADWLTAECTQNRHLSASGSAGAKRYWEAPAAAPAADAGAAGESSALGAGAVVAVHDPRGLTSFVNSPRFFSPVHWSPLPAVLADVAAPDAPDGAASSEPLPPARSGSWFWGAGGGS